MIQDEEIQQPTNPVDNLKNYITQLEQAIISKQQAIDNQRIKFYEIMKKVSADLDLQGVDAEQVQKYLDSIVLLPEDFDEPQQRKKNKNNIIRISKQEIQKVIQESQTISEVPSKQKRKYTKKQPSEEKQQKRKRRTKKEMEEARMQQQQQ